MMVVFTSCARSKGASAAGSDAFPEPDDETLLPRVTPGTFADELSVKP